MGKRSRAKRKRKNNLSNTERKNNLSNTERKNSLSNTEQKTPQTTSRSKKQKHNHSEFRKGDDPVIFGRDHAADVEENPSSEDLQCLLEPYSKDQLISLLADSAVEDPSLLSHILSVADQGVAHRKIFVRGFGWDVTDKLLFETFSPYGSVVDSTVVFDKGTGLNKGFGFVIFSTRLGALKALKEPEKKIGVRKAFCQLASIGPVPYPASTADAAQRKIYVSNVHAGVSPEKLKAFFATFGEIESGPFGIDLLTGKTRGYAIFMYKTVDGATRVLQEPYKMFEGNMLHCKLALDNSQKGKLPAIPAAQQSLPLTNQHPALNAVASTQNPTMLSQNPATLSQNPAMLSQNPAYNLLLVQNPLLTNAALNPNSITALNPSALATFNQSASLITPQGLGYGRQGLDGLGYGEQGYNGQGYGGHGYGGQGFGGRGYGGQSYGGHDYGGFGVGFRGSSLFGAYGALESGDLSFGGSQLGQSSSGTQGNGFFGGFRP